MFIMQNLTESRDTVQSVVRAFDILRAFTVERPVLGVSEIAAEVKLNRTTVHRLLATLESCGVVRRDPATHKYTIGTLVLKLSNVFLQQSNVRSAGLPVILSLRNATNQTSAIHIRQNAFRITVSQTESAQDLRVTYPELGEPIPLHLGAPGKVILAHLAPEEIEEYLGSVKLIAVTPNTPIDPEQLISELDKIREAGYALTMQERRSGVASIAAPIRDATGAVIASVNIAAPLQRITDEQMAQYIPLVIKAGQDISHQLGYHD